MSAPPGYAPTLTPHGIATDIASPHDVAELIAAYKAEGKRLSPGRARMLVAEHLAEMDRAEDRYHDLDADTRINGITSDPTPREAFKPAHLRRLAA